MVTLAMHRTFLNPLALPAEALYPEKLREIQSREALQAARDEIRSWPQYRPTPLCDLPALASRSGVARIWYKDEGGRFGVGSFKALGGAYAVFRLLARAVSRQAGQAVSSTDLFDGRYRALTRRITVTCATDGNHGRSVAWAAAMFGCLCRIYLHAHVSPGRCDAIARYGAEVVRTSGNYDDSVRQAAADARRNGWFVVSDTSYEGYVDVPRDVMQGYALMVHEALGQLPAGAWPTHVFVQGGVGGLAAAVCAYLWETAGARRPTFVIVEPDNADCLFRSAQAGKPVRVQGELDTLMAGLACGEPSVLAWQVLEIGANGFMTISDETAVACMRTLAEARGGDAAIVAGESAVAGLAGMLAARDAAEFALGPHSQVLVFGTEGDTDPELYGRLVGATGDQVRARNRAVSFDSKRKV